MPSDSGPGLRITWSLLLVLPLLAAAPAAPAPAAAVSAVAGDDFADRQPLAISAREEVVSVTTAGATAEPGEPTHAGAGSASIWFAFSVDEATEVALAVASRDFLPVVAVYRGASVGALTEVAASDAPYPTTGAVRLLADPGVEYSVAVAGEDGGSGAVRLFTALITGPTSPQERVPGHRRTGVTRVGTSASPVTAATEIAQATFPDGDAAGVLLARDDVFADSLAAAALAGRSHALLFVPGGPDATLPAEVAREIQRLLGADRPCLPGRLWTVTLIGGTGAVSPGVQSAVEDLGYCTGRLFGPSRVETAVAIAEAVMVFSPTDTDPVILLARDDDWADAATGGAFAAALGVPLLVNPSGSLHQAVRGFLSTARAHTSGPMGVVILGGRAAVSDQVAAEIGEQASVLRVAGGDREATAAAIMTQLWAMAEAWASPFILGVRPRMGIAGAVIVNGRTPDGWVYAQAAATYSARTRRPQLYSRSDAVGDAAAARLAALPGAGVTLVGPLSHIPAEVEQSIAAQIDRAFRPGEDRWRLRSGDPLDGANYFRGLAGAEPLESFDPALSAGAFDHARYAVRTGSDGHDEDPASPWSTPAGRGEAPGSEHAGRFTWGGRGRGDESNAFVLLARMPFHGSFLTDPHGIHVGVGSYDGADRAITVRFRPGELRQVDPDGDGLISTFPTDGALLPLTQMVHDGPTCPDGAPPAGLPLSAYFTDRTPADVSATSLTRSGAPVDHCATGHPRMPNQVILLPREQLVTGARYEAAITAAGRTFAWTFDVDAQPW